jgi:hypothetical protein
MAEIRNYTMNFGFHTTSAAPKLVSAATSRAQGARRVVARKMVVLRAKIRG